MRARSFGLLLLAGLLLRLWWLQAWGTFDVEVQKAWSARAAGSGLADIYGPPDRELLPLARARGWRGPWPKTVFDWGSAQYFVDYPPGSVLGLWAAGRLYGAFRPDFPNTRSFNAAINLAPLLGAVVIAALLRDRPERALAFWLNPALLLAAPILGYQDTIFGAFAVAAVLALMRERHATATALCVLAGLIKPQGALLLPVLAAVVLRETRASAWLRCAGAGLLAATLVLLPWWSQGHLLSALDGCRRPLQQGTLAPLGLNVWWIAGWLMDWERAGPWPLARIVTLDDFHAWAGWDARAVSRPLLALGTAASLVPLLRAPREQRHTIPLGVILIVHAYALFGTSVHENHTLLAVMLSPLLLGAWPRARATLALTSAFAFASLFLAAGFGRRVTRLRELETLRAATGLDLSVIVAAAHVALLATLFAWAARREA